MNVFDCPNLRVAALPACALALVACLAPVAAAQEADGSALLKQAYELSQKAEDEASYNRVLELCQKGLAAGVPGDSVKYARDLMSWAHNRRGQVKLDAGDTKAALVEFETALKLDPGRWRALHNRGYCRAAEGDLKGALEDFEKTISLNPKYSKAYFNRAEIYFAEGKFDSAIRDYSEALRINPNDSEAYNLRGHAYYRSRDFGRANADYNRALQLDPKNVPALVNRGDLLADFGTYAEAARDYQAALNADAESDRAYVSAAWLMATCPDAKFRNADLAIQAAEKALELIGDGDHPHRYRYLGALAAAQANAGQYEEAAKTQAQANELVPPEEQAKFAERLKLFTAGKPFRESRPAEKNSTSQR